MVVYNSSYKSTFYHPESKMMEEVWNAQSFTMTEEEFKEGLLAYVDLLKKYKPLCVLVDACDFRFSMSPDVQEWMVSTVFIHYAQTGMKYKAFIQSNDFFANMGLEQHLEEDHTGSFTSAMFASREEAEKWLYQKRFALSEAQTS